MKYDSQCLAINEGINNLISIIDENLKSNIIYTENKDKSDFLLRLNKSIRHYLDRKADLTLCGLNRAFWLR